MKKEKNKNNFISDFDLTHQVNPNINSIKYIKSAYENKFTSHLYSDSIIRGNYVNSLISILFNTNNIDNTKNIIEKFIKTSSDPSRIQFCIKIDNDDPEFVSNFIKELSGFNSHFIIIASPQGRGYIDLWQWINFLYDQSSKKSYFLLNISDEMHISTENWDINLEKYMYIQKDSIFRLRTSVYKNRNYNNIDECIYAPDTTAIYTRKYIDIQGNFCPCFGPDNAQQIIALYLSNSNYPRHTQFLRDYVINDIDFIGEGTNLGLSQESKYKRIVINYLLWKWSHKYCNQIEFKRRARCLQIEIIKNTIKDSEFIHLNDKKKYVMLIPGNYQLNKNDRRKTFVCLSYEVSRIFCAIRRYFTINYIRHQTGYDDSVLAGFACHISIFFLKKHPQQAALIFTKKNKKINIAISSIFIYFIKYFLLFITSPLTLFSKIFIQNNFLGKSVFLCFINPYTISVEKLKKSSPEFYNKEKDSYLLRPLIYLIKYYELVLDRIIVRPFLGMLRLYQILVIKFLIKPNGEIIFLKFLLNNSTILGYIFNIFKFFRRKKKFGGVSYYESKSIILVNKNSDESKSIVVKGDHN